MFNTASPRKPWSNARGSRVLVVVCVWAFSITGCASLTNPVADGIPVRQLPPELKGESREAEEPVPLNLLRQPPPKQYRLAPGDVLGIYIEGILGEKGQPLPVQIRENALTPPSIGFPIPVREDGTIPLPLVEPINVWGKTLIEVEEAIRKAYPEPKELLPPGKERILVSLQFPRQYQVLVVREDTGAVDFASGGRIGPASYLGSSTLVGSNRRGSGAVLNLPAYQNDVMTALAETGGLPGLGARNEVIILRDALGKGQAWPTVMPNLDGAYCQSLMREGGPATVIRIPLRLRPGEPIPFRPEDVILQNGDIVYIRSRDTELFYTGGLLGPGEFVLPRDYDLDVIEAIARVRGPLVNGGINQNNFTGQIFQNGLGFPSPSQLTVLRKTADGRQVNILVDLNRALQDPRDRILVQSGDFLILQETSGESIARYFSTNVLFNFFGRFIDAGDGTGTVNFMTP